MKKSITRRVFFSVVGVFLLVMTLQWIMQNTIVEDIYYLRTASRMDRQVEYLTSLLSQPFTVKDIQDVTQDLWADQDTSLLVLNKRGEIMNPAYLDTFNHASLQDASGHPFRILLYGLVDESGHFRPNFKAIQRGDAVLAHGVLIPGTNVLIPTDLSVNGAPLPQVDSQLFPGALVATGQALTLEGTVNDLQLTIRDRDLSSYQPERLLVEVFQLLVDRTNRQEDYNNILEDGGYTFVEEVSALELQVRVQEVQQGDLTHTLYLMTTHRPVAEAFTILNGYYLYIFAFQLALVVLIVFALSRYITRPVINLTQVATDIAQQNFTQRGHVETGDELESLSESLNAISDNLSTAIDHLEESNRDLAQEAIRREAEESRMRNMFQALSHEFKTPLGIMSGFVEVLRDGLGDKEPAYYYGAIEEEIDNLDSLVRSTLALSRMESGVDQVHLEAIDLEPYVASVLGKFANMAREKSIGLSHDLPQVSVAMDPLKMDQVLKNLIHNGIIYSPPGSQVTLWASLSSSQETPRTITIHITNTGVSIPHDQVDHIWDRFYRLDPSRNRASGGSGLGLTIVKHILDQHGSTYGVVSRDNEVVFSFTLPLV